MGKNNLTWQLEEQCIAAAMSPTGRDRECDNVHLKKEKEEKLIKSIIIE